MSGGVARNGIPWSLASSVPTSYPGSSLSPLPATPPRCEKTLVQAGHVLPQIIWHHGRGSRNYKTAWGHDSNIFYTVLKISKCFSFLQSSFLSTFCVSEQHILECHFKTQTSCLTGKSIFRNGCAWCSSYRIWKSLIFHVLPLIVFAKERLEKGLEFETLTPAFNDHFLVLLSWYRH